MWYDGIRNVLSQRAYLAVFIFASALFLTAYIFAWNLILLPDFFVRYDLWTLPNISFLIIISALSGMALALALHNLRMNMAFHKKYYGFLAVFPSFFTSMCPGCAPLALSFSSATFGIGLALTNASLIVNSIIIAVLLASLYFLSASTGKCRIRVSKK